LHALHAAGLERRLPVKPRRETPNAGVVGARWANRVEAAQAAGYVFGEHAAALGSEPLADAVGKLPENAVIIERQLIALLVDARRRQFPAGALAESNIEVCAEQQGQFRERDVPPFDLDGQRPGALPRFFGRKRIDADNVSRLRSEELRCAGDGETQHLKAARAYIADRPAHAHTFGVGELTAHR
jgi:hypothetical protein